MTGTTIDGINSHHNGVQGAAQGYGIAVGTDANHNTIKNSVVTDNYDEGIHFGTGSNFNTLQDSTFERNRIENVYLQAAHDNTLTNLSIKNAVNGIKLDSAQNTNMSRIDISGADLGLHPHLPGGGRSRADQQHAEQHHPHHAGPQLRRQAHQQYHRVDLHLPLPHRDHGLLLQAADGSQHRRVAGLQGQTRAAAVLMAGRGTTPSVPWSRRTDAALAVTLVTAGALAVFVASRAADVITYQLAERDYRVLGLPFPGWAFYTGPWLAGIVIGGIAAVLVARHRGALTTSTAAGGLLSNSA